PFNVSKCKVMHIGEKNIKYKYKIMGQELLETTEEKDLGVFFTDTYKSSTNCNKVGKKANKTIGLIRRYITNKGAEGMLILYKTLIRPVLDYCVPVWRPYRKKDMLKVEKVQKRSTKMIERYETKSYEHAQNSIVSMLDERSPVDIIYLDFQKAFDKVPHEYLMFKIR